jgi:hypothetical protein
VSWRFVRPWPALAAAAACCASAAPAGAYDVLAEPCAATPLLCSTGHVAFNQTDALPIQFDVDTGWVPQGSPVQVHLYADVYANTHVWLTGSLQTSWPSTLTLAAPGDPSQGLYGGNFGFHYGADFGAQGKVSISVAGQSYSWQGNLPFVPQFDLEVDAAKSFDAWAYYPGVALSSTSAPQQLASIGLSSIIGQSIPGIDGGFALDVSIELDALYTTNRIVIDTTDGDAVPGGPITAAGGTSSVPLVSGGSIELDVHPEGTVTYDGVVHMIPTFWVSLLGDKWSIPIVDVPVSFPIATTDWAFSPQRVHFPLPDLAVSVTELDFGVVEVGSSETLSYQLWNAGEATAAATMTTSDAITFPLVDESATLRGGKTFRASVEFVPQTPGAVSGQIVVASNDPKAPLQVIALKGVAQAKPAVAITPPPAEPVPDVDYPNDCGCRVVGLPPRGAPLAVLALMGAAALRRRRRGRGPAITPRRGAPAP